MKALFTLLFLTIFTQAFGQNTLEFIIKKVSNKEEFDTSFSYFDKVEKNKGISIQNETQILKRLKLNSLKDKEYYITGKYEINNLIVLFLSEYSISEEVHFAVLLDKSLNIIDILNETAYYNDEGFYGVSSYVHYNIITTTVHNLYNNPEYIDKKYTITNKGFKPVKNQVIVKTPSGVRIRKKPTTKSEVVASAKNLDVFNCLSVNYEIDATTVFDEGNFLKDNWLEISKKDTHQQLGYVFGAFAKRHIEAITNDYTIIIDEINKEDFRRGEKQETSIPVTYKITDFKEIKKVLNNQLIGFYDEYAIYRIEKIIADNGKEIRTNLDDCSVMEYYPKYHYLLLECGHSSDYLINLKNGKDDVNRIGNPDYYVPSPNNIFRLNGYYNGQTNVYFLEKNNKNAQPEYMFEISDLLPLAYITKYFWTDDNTIYLKIENDYYKIQLQKIKE